MYNQVYKAEQNIQMTEGTRKLIVALIRGLEFTASLLRKVLKGEEI